MNILHQYYDDKKNLCQILFVVNQHNPVTKKTKTIYIAIKPDHQTEPKTVNLEEEKKVVQATSPNQTGKMHLASVRIMFL